MIKVQVDVVRYVSQNLVDNRIVNLTADHIGVSNSNSNRLPKTGLVSVASQTNSASSEAMNSTKLNTHQAYAVPINTHQAYAMPNTSSIGNQTTIQSLV